MPSRLASMLPLAAALLAGCHVDFAPQYLVRDLRILAIRAEVQTGADDPITLADPDVGMTLSLQALVANPQRLAPLTLSWKACLPTLDQPLSPCLDPEVLRDPGRLASAQVIDLGQGQSITYTVPLSLAPVLASLLDRARARPELACGLYAELPVVLIASAGTQQQVAVKVVRVAPFREVAGSDLDGAYVVSRNPALQEIESNAANPELCSGGPPVARPCRTAAQCAGAACLPSSDGRGQCDDLMLRDPQTLCARTVVNSQGTYYQCQADGTRIEYWEQLSYQWYTTGGIIRGRSGETSQIDVSGNQTGSYVDFSPPGGPFTLWVIIRNGRGGVGWVMRDYP